MTDSKWNGLRGLVSNDDNTPVDDDDDDYSTGVTWWELCLMIIGSAAFMGLIAYFVVCRRIQKRSNSEIFNAHVITAPDDVPNQSSNQNSGNGRSRAQTIEADYRQALMHDDDEARDILIRSAILFDDKK
mmetsp:Transcript_22907/g.29869  ORF Transcript_22907/g.29869 Transcript_22907/m.29869 type:complete len:130 (-) Transcript_22907:64-453(-)